MVESKKDRSRMLLIEGICLPLLSLCLSLLGLVMLELYGSLVIL